MNFEKKNSFKYKNYFNKSLNKNQYNILNIFNFYFFSTLLYFKNFYKFYLFLTVINYLNTNEKKSNYLIFKKKLMLSKNIFNLALFDYYYSNLNSLIFFNNLYIFNIFNLNFLLNKDEFFNKNIVAYNNLYPIFNKKNSFFESKFVNKNIFNFDKFFNIFILTFYEKLFKSFFFIKLNFNSNLKNFYKNYYKNYPFPAANIQDNYTIDEMFEMFCFSFVNRDINILNN